MEINGALVQKVARGFGYVTNSQAEMIGVAIDLLKNNKVETLDEAIEQTLKLYGEW